MNSQSFDSLQIELCPVCDKPSQPPFQPFCSSRCKLTDLGNWFGEVYRVPVEEPENLPEEESE
ncbi:MAG: DNA gyrase inhibitor YacG [Alphaproteobacteria bacterium]|nr:DNA gyrase inhibitor YacG [Alphaproteobacteria bacterium]